MPKTQSPNWTERFVADPATQPEKLVIKGTCLLVEDLADLVEEGQSDEVLSCRFPDLTPEDFATIHQCARVPAGSWADDPAGLDTFLEWNHRQRELSRWRISK